VRSVKIIRNEYLLPPLGCLYRVKYGDPSHKSIERRMNWPRNPLLYDCRYLKNMALVEF